MSFLETRIDAHAAEHPAPGFVSLHRLNRTEYERAVGEILAVKIDAAALLPKDVRDEGFDNVANILKVSPSFLDQYLWAAREVSVAAVGDPKGARASTTYRAGAEDARMYVPGMPLGSSGGLLATHYFPVDGEYTFNVGGRLPAARAAVLRVVRPVAHQLLLPRRLPPRLPRLVLRAQVLPQAPRSPRTCC